MSIKNARPYRTAAARLEASLYGEVSDATNFKTEMPYQNLYDRLHRVGIEVIDPKSMKDIRSPDGEYFGRYFNFTGSVKDFVDCLGVLGDPKKVVINPDEDKEDQIVAFKVMGVKPRNVFFDYKNKFIYTLEN